VDTLLARFPVL